MGLIFYITAQKNHQIWYLCHCEVPFVVYLILPNITLRVIKVKKKTFMGTSPVTSCCTPKGTIFTHFFLTVQMKDFWL